MSDLLPAERAILDDMLERRSDLADCVAGLVELHDAVVTSYDAGGTLFVCGNGGSFAQSMHIVGELGKSFERQRPVPSDLTEKFDGLPFGDELARHLEVGLRAITLGLNSSLKTAVENDSPMRDIAFAQETYALARPGDVLLGISTSGNADNCLMAMSVARALGATAAALTGPHGGPMAAFADIAVKVPGADTKLIQEAHLVVCHTLCVMVEAHYFPETR